jgi:transcription initiation factor IIE alpha subunit
VATGKKTAGKAREGTHRVQVIALIQRKGGATLDEIMKATGWQKHTVCGFISILGSKGGIKVTSTRRESDGARVSRRKHHTRFTQSRLTAQAGRLLSFFELASTSEWRVTRPTVRAVCSSGAPIFR